MSETSGDRHARDFAAWERQLAPRQPGRYRKHGKRRHRSRGRIVMYVAVFGFVGLCAAGLAATGDHELAAAVLVLACLIGALWFTDMRG